MSKITNDAKKYHYVLGTLDTEIAELVSDFIFKTLPWTPYSKLKRRVITEFEESGTESKKADFRNRTSTKETKLYFLPRKLKYK